MPCSWVLYGYMVRTCRLSLMSGMVIQFYWSIWNVFCAVFIFIFVLHSFYFSLFFPIISLMYLMPSPKIGTIISSLLAVNYQNCYISTTYQSKLLYFYNMPIIFMEYCIFNWKIRVLVLESLTINFVFNGFSYILSCFCNTVILVLMIFYLL